MTLALHIAGLFQVSKKAVAAPTVKESLASLDQLSLLAAASSVISGAFFLMMCVSA